MLFNKFRWWTVSTLIACTTMLWTARAHAFNACNMGFDNQFGLSLLHYEQAYGFMVPNEGIWYYNQCSTTQDWFYFDEDPATSYGHFHIPAESPSATNCFTFTGTYPNGVWGKTNGSGNCIALDPTTIPRTVVSHQPDERFRFMDLSQSNIHWRPRYITVLADSAPVRVTYLAANGVTWYFANLTPGLRWFLNPPIGPGTGGVEAWISVEPGAGGGKEFDIDDVLIDYTYD
jgi:hypothetical protein